MVGTAGVAARFKRYFEFYNRWRRYVSLVRPTSGAVYSEAARIDVAAWFVAQGLTKQPFEDWGRSTFQDRSYVTAAAH